VGALRVRITVPTKPEERHREKLEHAALTCPVQQSLHPDVKIPVEFVWG
jgi:putative redox protein